ncbi:MAG TPA: cupredoxin domain-containing protein [Burkholderiales bacterium]|nr:cupredoxin domain-containing protein [Burkholderiales bacterium]
MNINFRTMRLGAAATILALGSTLAYVAVHAAPRPKVIKISAKRFDYTPGNLTLKKGQPVVFELASRDVMMGFNVPDLKVRGDMIPGKVTRVQVIPDKTGTFTFFCDIFCGTGHEEMHGSITVVD